jgi:cell wall-associated NlpC family hydrolase
VPATRLVLRALTLTVAISGLAGGLGMSAASASTAAPTVTRAVSGSVPAGQQVSLAASVHAGGHAVVGARVELFRIAPSGRVLVTTVATDRDGSAVATVSPAVTTRYYWRFAGSTSYGPSGTRIVVTVREAPVVPLGERIVAEAARHIGAPYVYGATGPAAFDCSGFTRYVFGRLGISLPRTSAEQYAAVRHVGNADKRIGDLVFFRLGGGGVDHVGIYAGNNQILVAPKTGDHVRYQTIWTSYAVGRAG